MSAAELPDLGNLRVLVVAACPFPDLRGTAARVKLLAALAARCGAEVEIVSHAAARPLPVPVPVRRATRRRLPGSTRPGPSAARLLLHDPLLALATRRACARLRPHVLHAHHVEGVLVARSAARRHAAALVYDAHTSLREELPTWAGPLAALAAGLGARIEGALARRAHHVITVSESLRGELAGLARLAPERLTTVPTPLDPLPGGLPGRARAAGTGLRVVYAGGLSRFQGLDLLRAAFERRVWPARPDARLELLACDDRAALERVWPGASQQPRLAWRAAASPAEDLERLASADLAVVPRSARGGLPQKIVNAMRAGVAIVACEGAWDGLAAGHARLVAAGDADAFGDAVLELMANPAERARLATAARAEAERRFAPATVARRLQLAYQAACSASQRARVSPSSVNSVSGSSASSSISSTISSV